MSQSFHRHFHRQHHGPLAPRHWVDFSLSFGVCRLVRLHLVCPALHRPQMRVHLVLVVFELILVSRLMTRLDLVHYLGAAMTVVLEAKTTRPCPS